MRWRGRATQRNWWFMLYLALEITLQRAWLTSPICCVSSLKPSALAVPWLRYWGPGTLLVGQHVTAELSPPAPCPEWDLPQQTLLLLYPQPASSYSRSVKTPLAFANFYCELLRWFRGSLGRHLCSTVHCGAFLHPGVVLLFFFLKIQSLESKVTRPTNYCV